MVGVCVLFRGSLCRSCSPCGVLSVRRSTTEYRDGGLKATAITAAFPNLCAELGFYLRKSYFSIILTKLALLWYATTKCHICISCDRVGTILSDVGEYY